MNLELMLQLSKLKSQRSFASRRKPEAMLDNIAKGIARFFKDNTLVNQDYIKDSKLSVANCEVFRQRSYCYRFQRAAYI
jgi:translation elongation factor EF-Ts